MSSLKQKFNKLLRGRVGEHDPDYTLIAIIFVLVIFGLIMLSSASAAVAYLKSGDSYYYFKHQLFGLLIGMVAFLILSRIDYHLWKRYAFWFLIGSILLLLLVFIPGLSGSWGKARSWINFFGYSLQPSEFVKLSFLLYLAAWLERRGKSLHNIQEGIGPFIFILAIIAALMVLQPDMGTLTIIGATSFIVYYVGGGSVRHILTIFIASLMILAFLVYLKPYQLDRFRCLLNPAYDSAGICYQVNQSLIAIGSGGFWGRGLGASRQKFLYLPEVYGDSIFAVIGEEAGLAVSILLVLLFLYLFRRGALIAQKAPDGFGRILAIGIVSWLTLQALVNIGGMVNLIPMTGVPLPFISYGGSAILAAMAASGILVNISKQTRVR